MRNMFLYVIEKISTPAVMQYLESVFTAGVYVGDGCCVGN